MARAGGTSNDTQVDPRLWCGAPTTVEARQALWPAAISGVVIAAGWSWILGFPGPGSPLFWQVLVVVAVFYVPLLIRLVGRRPWVIVSDEGVAAGGWYSSAFRRRNVVRWSEVVAISPVRYGPPGRAQPRPRAERPSLRSAPLTPLKELSRRAVPREFSIARVAGRPLVVRAPLRGITIDTVHADVVERWQRFGDPDVAFGDSELS